MPAGRLTDAHLVIGAAALTVMLGGAAAFIDPSSRSGGDAASSFNTGAGGAKAAFHTLQALGYRLERSFEPMTAIHSDPAHTTLVLTGTVAPSDQDRLALQNFARAGGAVLLVGVQGADFLGIPGGRRASAMPGPVATHRVFAPSPLAEHTRAITMTDTDGSPPLGPAYVPVFARDFDQPLVATALIGQGRVTWWASATPLANAHIGDADNLQLLLNVMGPAASRLILWDEHYHGHSRSLWSYAARTPLPWLAAQLAILALAVLGAYSRRRGPVRSAERDARTSPMEFIEMLLALYKRGGAAGAAVAAARARVRRTASAVCGVPHDASDEVLARTVSSRFPVDRAEVERLLAQSESATRRAALPAAEALDLARRLQQLAADLSPRRGLQSA